MTEHERRESELDAADKQDDIDGDERLPPEIQATPTDLPDRAEEGLTWWRPSWGDVLRSVGWRWILLAPVLLVLLLPSVAWFYPPFREPIAILGFKLFIFVIAVAISLAGGSVLTHRCASRPASRPMS